MGACASQPPSRPRPRTVAEYDAVCAAMKADAVRRARALGLCTNDEVFGAEMNQRHHTSKDPRGARQGGGGAATAADAGAAGGGCVAWGAGARDDADDDRAAAPAEPSLDAAQVAAHAERLRILPPQLWSSMTSLIVPAGEDVPEGVAPADHEQRYYGFTLERTKSEISRAELLAAALNDGSRGLSLAEVVRDELAFGDEASVRARARAGARALAPR